MTEPAQSLSELFLQDLQDFEDEIVQEDALLKGEGEPVMDMAEEQFPPERLKDYETVDLIAQEKSKLVESELYKKVKSMIEQNKTEQAKTSVQTFEAVLDCNTLLTQIDQQIHMIHNFLRFVYAKKFPELESLVLEPLGFARCVQRLEESQGGDVQLADILTNHLVVAVKIALSQTKKKTLSPNDRSNALRAAQYIIFLHEEKTKFLEYVEDKMFTVAPNLSTTVGRSCAAKLLAAAGGLAELARMPSCNIQVMGSSKKSLLGMSRIGQGKHGFFSELDLVKKCPEDYKTRLVKMLANNCAKTAKIDQSGLAPDGSLGKRLFQELMDRFSKIQEPTFCQPKKPQIMEDEKPKRRRGGKKYRKMKERLGLTDMRKLQNRVLMDPNNPQAEDIETGIGFGMLGQGDTGRLRIDAKKQKQNLTKKQKKLLAHKAHTGTRQAGMTSTLVFAPNQGIQLVDPAHIAEVNARAGRQSQFFKNDGFKTVLNERINK